MHPEHRDAPEYLLARLKEALAADERVNALDIDVSLHGEDIAMAGTVHSRERRDAAEAVARSVAPHHRILNNLEVKDLSGAPEETPPVAVRVAAVGDVHFGVDSAGSLRKHLERIQESADMLLLAGDLTRHGTEEEAAVLAAELENLGIPVIAVLGNHDHHSDQPDRIAKVLQEAGITVLEKSACVVEVGDITVGVAGVKGFGGGFIGASGSDFGEPMMKAFVAESRDAATALREHLLSLDTDVRIALTHFSPVEDTLRGERLEIYGWLGSYYLAEAIDDSACDFAFHGHAHAGSEVGMTPGGVPVRNVAQPVLGQAYKIYCIEPERTMAEVTAIDGLAG